MAKTRSKTSHGQGSPPKAWNGRYRAKVAVPQPDGTLKPQAVYGKTLKECTEKWQELKRQVELSGELPPKDPTLNEWFKEWTDIKRTQVTERSLEEYEYTSRHMLRHLGKVRLGNLRAIDVQKMQMAVLKETSPRAAVKSRSLLFSMVQDAMKLELVQRNVVALVDPVKYKTQKFPIWSAEEVDKFLIVTERVDYYPWYYTALTTGMRPGELIALHWDDLFGNKLRVQHGITVVKNRPGLGDVKTVHGNRILTLPEDTLEVLERQREYVGGSSKLVFPSRNGTFLGSRNIRRNMQKHAVDNGITKIRLHDMRHTYASMRIADGVDPLRLSRELGHHAPSFTMNHYGHIFEQYRKHKPPTLARLLGRVKEVEEELFDTPLEVTADDDEDAVADD